MTTFPYLIQRTCSKTTLAMNMPVRTLEIYKLTLTCILRTHQEGEEEEETYQINSEELEETRKMPLSKPIYI